MYVKLFKKHISVDQFFFKCLAHSPGRIPYSKLWQIKKEVEIRVTVFIMVIH